MTVQELITELEQMNPDAEVRFASQPCPFEYDIKSVIAVYQNDEDSDDIRDDHSPVVYLEEGQQIGYLPQYVANEIRNHDNC